MRFYLMIREATYSQQPQELKTVATDFFTLPGFIPNTITEQINI
jgi:hypothetical protein